MKKVSLPYYISFHISKDQDMKSQWWFLRKTKRSAWTLILNTRKVSCIIKRKWEKWKRAQTRSIRSLMSESGRQTSFVTGQGGFYFEQESWYIVITTKWSNVYRKQFYFAQNMSVEWLKFQERMCLQSSKKDETFRLTSLKTMEMDQEFFS